MPTTYEPHCTYMGLLDDVVYRHTPSFSSYPFFNRMIAKNLFFGGGLYINDGYLVNHPAARDYLTKETSLLRVMMRYGFIRILTRAKDVRDLVDMPIKMASQGASSFQQLVNSSEWTTFKRDWTHIAEAAFESGHVQHWPNFQMQYGFTKLIHSVLSSDPNETGIKLSKETLLRITEEFFSRRPLLSGPRGKLEDAAKLILDNSALSSRARKSGLRSLMHVAAQAYHYNFGLCMRWESEEGRKLADKTTPTARKSIDLCVDTTYGMAFDELLETDPVDLHDIDLPLFGLPANYRFEDGEVFASLAQDDSETYRAKVSLAKTLWEACSQMDSATPRERKQAITSAMRKFIKELHSDLKGKLNDLPRDNDYFDSTTPKHAMVAYGKGQSRVGVGTSLSFLTHVIATDKHCRKGVDFLVRRGILNPKAPITLREIKPVVTSLRFDREKARAFIKGLPTLE